VTLRSLSSSSVHRAVGQPWEIIFTSRDADGLFLADEPAVTVTLPDLTTAPATITSDYAGVYLATYTPLVAGRFTARAVTPLGYVLDALCVVTAITAALPDADDLNLYLGENEHSWTDAELADALAAETTAQMNVCRVPASYPEDLREALLRRAARNLAMRRQLTAEPRGEGDVDLPAVLPVAADAEVKRLERPYRRVPVG
jgi:hypothetical protein